MLRYWNYDIVFQEVPGEITLAVNITNCPIGCKGCHSSHLTADVGDILDEKSLDTILEKYRTAITCVCFMGGDSAPDEVEQLAHHVRMVSKGRLKTAWYSGRLNFPTVCTWQSYNFVKLGPYVEELGGLDSLNTNQRFYAVERDRVVDITTKFQKEHQ